MTVTPLLEYWVDKIRRSVAGGAYSSDLSVYSVYIFHLIQDDLKEPRKTMLEHG